MQEETNKLIYLHIPKTGGAAMEYYFYNQTKNTRRNYFLSFFGVDDSRYIQDEYSTKRPNGNHCLIENIFSNKDLQRSLFNSPHFKQARMLFGHTVYGWNTLLPQYNFEYVTVVRDPIDRVISNILQYTTTLRDGRDRLGKFFTPQKNTHEYWEFVYNIFSDHNQIPGMLPHENMNLKNCQTRVFEGQDLSTYKESVDLELAKDNSKNINFSFFDDFNGGLQRTFDLLKVPITMDKNNKPAPKTNKASQHGDLMSLLREWNKQDILLFNFLKTAKHE